MKNFSVQIYAKSINGNKVAPLKKQTNLKGLAYSLIQLKNNVT